MTYIPIPAHIEEEVIALVKSMYREHEPQWITLSASSKNPYSGRGQFISGTTPNSFIWSYGSNGARIDFGPGD